MRRSADSTPARPSRLVGACVLGSALAVALALRPALTSANGEVLLPITAVDAVGFTVSDMDRALAFYTGVLPFSKISEREVSGRQYELLAGLFGARSRVARLRLGTEELELTEFLSPRGRPIPNDVRANDRVFQHIAIVVSDITGAYQTLREHQVEPASTSPQRLP